MTLAVEATLCRDCEGDYTMNECVLLIENDDLIESSPSYLVWLLGINLSANDLNAPSVTLTPCQFENAVSRIAAQLIWIGMLP